MAIATADDFFTLLEKSKLLSAEQLAEARELVESSGGKADDAVTAARLLTKHSLLTRWQAGQLLAGRSTFFLGKYKLIELLGRGGMGSVFLGEHIMMNRRVAIKVLGKQLGREPGSLERFLSEARAIAALDHPNIVHAYNVDQEGDRYYIVMEYVDGVNLEQMVKRNGPLDCALAAEFVRQAAEGLAHAHKQEIVHCDIKPSNLVVNNQRVLKILDMGLARLVGRAESANEKADESILGSVDYLAPEQALESEEFDHRADIYSLGCTLYFLLTGRPPFPEGTLHEKILKHQRVDPTPISELREDAPAGLIEICERMMAKDPAERFQSADEVAEAISALGLTPRPKKRPASLKKAEAIDDEEANQSSDSNGEFPVLDLSVATPRSKAKAAAKKPIKKPSAGDDSDEEKEPGDEGPRAALPARMLALWRTPRGKMIIGSVGAVAVMLLVGIVAAAFVWLGGSSDKQAIAKKPSSSAVKSGTVVIVADEPTTPPTEQPATKDSAKSNDGAGENSGAKDDAGGTKSPSDEPKKGEGDTKASDNAQGNSGASQSTPTTPAEEPGKPSEKPSEPTKPAEKPAEPSKQPDKPAETQPAQPKKPDPPKPTDKPKPPPKYEPFKELPKAIELPKVPKEEAESGVVGEPKEIAPLKLAADKPLSVQLLGGQAFKAFDFELAPDASSPGKAWTIAEQTKGQKAERVELARVSLDGEKLLVQWLAGAVKAPARANQLRNCGLKLVSGGANHFVAFNQPQPVAPILLDFDRPKPIPVNVRLDTQPEPSMVRVQIKKPDLPNMKVEISPADVMLPPVTERGRVDSSKSELLLVVNEKSDKVKRKVGDKDEEFLKFPLVLRFRLTLQGNQCRILWEPNFRRVETGAPEPLGRLSDAQNQMALARSSIKQADEFVKKQPPGMSKDQAEQLRKLAHATHEGFTGLVGVLSMLNKSTKIGFTVYVEADGERVEIASTEVEGAPPPKGAEPETPEPVIDTPSVPKRFFTDDEPKKK